jgi:ABC-type Na+ efflux pump permease subunit
VLVSLFFSILIPFGLIVLVIRPQLPAPGLSLTFYMLTVGLLPALSAVGIAAGQFAGEQERGVLLPLLASPASNLALFGGKVLGAVLPALLYALVAETVYVLGVGGLLGPSQLQLLLTPLAAVTLVLVPAVTGLAAIMASLISSRVRTFNAAQQLGGLILGPVIGLVLAVMAKLLERGIPAVAVGALALLLVDLALAALSAATWRREEVLSRR